MFVIGGRGGFIAEIGGGSLAKRSMETNNGLGGVENKSLVGSKLMASDEECLDGGVRTSGGDVKDGGGVFGVSRIFIGVIPKILWGKVVVKHLELMEEPSDNRLVVREDDKEGTPIEAHLAPTQPTQVNKITTSCEICSGPHDTQYHMEDPEQALVDYQKYKKTYEEVESEKEVEEETKGETEEEEEDDPERFGTFLTVKELRYHEWILKNPRPPLVKAKIRTENVNNVELSCMIERVKGLRVFVGNFTYEYDFMVLDDTTSVIDHYLGSVVFEKPFMEATRLVYNKEEGTVMLERDKERIVLKIPHNMDMFKHIDVTNIGTDSIPSFVIESDDDNCEKTHYSVSLDLGPEYKHDEYVCRGIQSLMAAKSRRKNKGEVT
nr:hypothetical protein [Tanacetum cinerariifolium]